MRDMPEYPIGKPQYTEKPALAKHFYESWKQNKIGLGFVNCRVFIPMQHIPPLPVKMGKLCFPCGEVYGTWTYEELEYAEYQAKNGGTYYTKRDYDIIKDCVEDMEDLLENIKKHSKLSENKSHLLEVYHHPFDRDIETDVIKPYKYYYKSLNFKKDYKTKVNDYVNYDITNVSYNGTSRTLKIEAVIGLKAYGDGYERRCIYKGDRSKYDRNTFEFDEYLSQNIADIIYPIGLVKTGLYYPTKYFHYSDYHQTAPHKLHWVDHVILDVTKIYD